MARQQSASSLDRLGFATNEEEKEFKVITVSSPLAGFYSLGSPFQVPSDSLSYVRNNTFANLALEKRPGISQIGQGLTVDVQAYWGGMLMMSHPTSPPVVGLTQLRLNGRNTITGNLYKLNDDDPDPDNWRWVGVLSGLETATAADQMTDGYALATSLVQAMRLYITDGSARRKVFLFGTTPNRIVDWGLNVGVPAAGTIAAETTGGVGYLLTGRNYSMQYQIIDEATGFKSQRSAVSNVWLTTLLGDNSELTGTIPAFPTLPAGTYTVRVARSTGAIPPAPPAEWLEERDYTGITNLQTTPMPFALDALDGDLGPTQLEEVYPLAPRGRFLLRDPSGDRALIFGDPTAQNVVYWSEDGQYGNWPPINQTLPIDDDDCDVLHGGFVGINGRVFVMKKRRGIYELRQTINGAYQPVLIEDSTGCWSHYSIVVRNGLTYWLSLEGAVEFDGNRTVNISDDKVRQFFKEITIDNDDLLNGDLSQPIGIANTRAGSATVEWAVRNSVTSDLFRLIYDLNLKNWTIWHLADGFAAAGGAAWVQWHGREDPGDGDGLDHIYSSDNEGRAYKFWFDDNEVDGEPVYTDCRSAYTWDVRTAWFGNGLDTYIPRYMDFLIKVRPRHPENDGSAGQFTVNFYVNGSDDVQHSVTYPIPSEDDYPDVDFVWGRFRCDSPKSPCRKFRFGFYNNRAGDRPLVPWFQIKYTSDAPRLKGLSALG